MKIKVIATTYRNEIHELLFTNEEDLNWWLDLMAADNKTVCPYKNIEVRFEE